MAAPAPVEQVLALQRSAGNHAVTAMIHRTIRHDPESLGALEYEEGSDDGNAVTLDDVVAELLEAVPGLAGQEKRIRAELQPFASDDVPDLVYDNTEGLAQWLADKGIKATAAQPEAGDEKEAPEDGSESESESGEGKGMKIGKLFFEGDTYHRVVKPKVIGTIGASTLRGIIKGRKGQDNFNFWFAKDGEIFVGDNSNRTSKGKSTGYRWDGKDVVQI